MKKYNKIISLILLFIIFTSCTPKVYKDHSQFKVSKSDEIVMVETSVGKFRMKLLKEAAPNQVENFKNKVKNGELIGLDFGIKLANRSITAYGGIGKDKDESVLIKDKINSNYYLFQGAVFIPRFAENGNAYFDGLSFGIVTNQGIKADEAKRLNPKLNDETAKLLEKYNGEAKSQGRLVIFAQVIDGFDTLTKIEKTEKKVVIVNTKLED